MTAQLVAIVFWRGTPIVLYFTQGLPAADREQAKFCSQLTEVNRMACLEPEQAC